ncbi:cellulose binding domain-containing protein [Glycomyces tarimensis]
MEERQDEPEAPQGRLHGHMFRILAVLTVVVALVAIWLLSPVMFSDDESSANWPWAEEPTVVFSDDGEPSSEAASSVEDAASSAEPSMETSMAQPETAQVESDEPAPSSKAPEESAREDEPAEPSCSATLRLEDEWRDYVQVSVVVVNTGEEVLSGWEVTIAIDGVDVHNSWGMRHTDGDRYRNDDWNGALDPGEDAVATFQAEGDEDDLPDSVPCTAFA